MFALINRLVCSRCNYSSVKLLCSNKYKLIYETKVSKNLSIFNRTNSLKQSPRFLLPSNQTVVCLSTVTNAKPKTDILDKLQSVQAKKRPLRKKAATKKAEQLLSVVAFSTAEEYNLEDLGQAIKDQALYEYMAFNDEDEDVMHLRARYQLNDINREIFIFREGSIVFWNMPSVECEAVLEFIKPFEVSAYDPVIIEEEKEEMDFDLTPNSKTKLQKGTIYLHTKSNESSDLEKYAFSNAIALSVKLAIWEASLDRYIDSIEYVTKDMKEGKKIKLTRDQVFRKTGELFTLKHRINLSSDLLDTPDFYWDRQELERLFMDTVYHLNVSKRTKVMNEKLSHCVELMELLSSHLNDIHHVRLEWMIIILIMVEVLFEFIHYAEKIF